MDERSEADYGTQSSRRRQQILAALMEGQQRQLRPQGGRAGSTAPEPERPVRAPPVSGVAKASGWPLTREGYAGPAAVKTQPAWPMPGGPELLPKTHVDISASNEYGRVGANLDLEQTSKHVLHVSGTGERRAPDGSVESVSINRDIHGPSAMVAAAIAMKGDGAAGLCARAAATKLCMFLNSRGLCSSSLFGKDQDKHLAAAGMGAPKSVVYELGENGEMVASTSGATAPWYVKVGIALDSTNSAFVGMTHDRQNQLVPGSWSVGSLHLGALKPSELSRERVDQVPRSVDIDPAFHGALWALNLAKYAMVVNSNSPITGYPIGSCTVVPSGTPGATKVEVTSRVSGKVSSKFILPSSVAPLALNESALLAMVEASRHAHEQGCYGSSLDNMAAAAGHHEQVLRRTEEFKRDSLKGPTASSATWLHGQ